jgi:hypothetical protein
MAATYTPSYNYPSSTTVFLKESDRIIIPDADTDSAVILAHPGDL